VTDQHTVEQTLDWLTYLSTVETDDPPYVPVDRDLLGRAAAALRTTETQRDALAATLAKAREMVTEIEATADDSCGPDAFDEAVADLVAFLLTMTIPGGP